MIWREQSDREYDKEVRVLRNSNVFPPKISLPNWLKKVEVDGSE